MCARNGEVPVLGCEGGVDGVEGDDLAEEGKHVVAVWRVGEVGDGCVAAVIVRCSV